MEKVYIVVSNITEEIRVTRSLKKAKEIKKQIENRIIKTGFLLPNVYIKEVNIE